MKMTNSILSRWNCSLGHICHYFCLQYCLGLWVHQLLSCVLQWVYSYIILEDIYLCFWTFCCHSLALAYYVLLLHYSKRSIADNRYCRLTLLICNVVGAVVQRFQHGNHFDAALFEWLPIERTVIPVTGEAVKLMNNEIRRLLHPRSSEESLPDDR